MAKLALSEDEWQDLVLGLARAYGWRAYHTHDSRRSPAGFPDLVLGRASRHSGTAELLVVELKTDNGKVEPDQQAWLDLFAAAERVETGLWRPRDERTVRERLGKKPLR